MLSLTVGLRSALQSCMCPSRHSRPLQVKFAVNTETGEKVAIKILDKEKIQKQNMGAQIKKEVRSIFKRALPVQLAMKTQSAIQSLLAGSPRRCAVVCHCRFRS